MRITRSLLLAAAIGLFSISADASPTPPHIQQARKLSQDARRLDARALRHQRAAERHDDEADRQRDRESALRRRAKRDPRLHARADDAAVSAAIAIAKAKHERREAAKIRAIAKRVRVDAKRAARTPIAAAPRDAAKLDVTSRQLCRLSVDGTDRGFTPVVELALLVGRHRIACTTLDGETITRNVRLRARTRQRLTLLPKGLRDPFSISAL